MSVFLMFFLIKTLFIDFCFAFSLIYITFAFMNAVFRSAAGVNVWRRRKVRAA